LLRPPLAEMNRADDADEPDGAEYSTFVLVLDAGAGSRPLGWGAWRPRRSWRFGLPCVRCAATGRLG